MRSTAPRRISAFAAVFAAASTGALGLAACAGDAVPEATPEALTPDVVWFEEVGAEVGLDFTHSYGVRRRYWMPETVASGVAFLDVDDDGFLDLYAVQGGDLGGESTLANRLFRNGGDGSFEDVTDTVGGGDVGYGMGVACADYDGDGDTDLFVTNVGPNALFRNDGGERLVDVTAATGAGDPGWGTSANFFDYDADGDLDIFVTNYLNWTSAREVECSTSYSAKDYCGPNNYNAPARDLLLRNDDGVYTDVTAAAGMGEAFGNGLGVATGDLDGDGREDVYVANDLLPNFLWRNQGDGTFREDALLMGCAVNANGLAEAGMGVFAHDFQADGDLDLFITHLNAQSNTFYLNGGTSFVDETISLGLSAPSLQYTGFGVGFGDFDADGLDDIFVANGRVAAGLPIYDKRDIYAEPNQLMRGTAEGRFEEVPACGLARPIHANTRGSALGDVDNDGDIDVACLDSGARLKLLRNVHPSPGHWITLRVLERTGGDAIGAWVGIGAEGERRWRPLQPGYGFASSNDPRVHFGLGPRTVGVPVHVRWTDGTETAFGVRQVDRIHVLRRE